MKKWTTLTNREKRLVFMGTSTTMICILFFGIINPLHDKIKNMEIHIANNTALLTWMQENTPKLKMAKNLNQTPSFSEIEKIFHHADFEKYKPNISLSTNNQIAISFDEIPFELFISNIMNHQLSVANIDVQTLDVPGLVKVEAVIDSHSS